MANVVPPSSKKTSVACSSRFPFTLSVFYVPQSYMIFSKFLAYSRLQTISKLSTEIASTRFQNFMFICEAEKYPFPFGYSSVYLVYICIMVFFYN